jgi:hypothetical protein
MPMKTTSSTTPLTALIRNRFVVLFIRAWSVEVGERCGSGHRRKITINQRGTKSMNEGTKSTTTESKAIDPASALFGGLSDSERRQIAEILDRRANDVASFKYDTEKKLGQPLGDYRGSVEMAMTREVTRLRRLAEKINPPAAEDDE